jgi:hypothetical protein
LSSHLLLALSSGLFPFCSFHISSNSLFINNTTNLCYTMWAAACVK